MPNYRYHSSDYMRHGQYSRQGSSSCDMQKDTSGSRCHNEKITCEELSNLPLAMAYVPWQEWGCLHEPETGFRRGTIFQSLDKPFQGIGGCQNVRS